MPHEPQEPAPSDVDRELVRRAQAGDERATGELISRLQDKVYTTCLCIVSNPDSAAECAQETFVKVLEHLDRYDGRAAPLTWVISIAVNTCRSRLRRDRRRSALSLDLPPAGHRSSADSTWSGRLGARTSQSRELSGELGVQKSRDHRLLLEALSRLPDTYRTILVLRDVRDLEYEQLAEALGLTLGTIKSRLFRARKALREMIEQLDDEFE